MKMKDKLLELERILQGATKEDLFYCKGQYLNKNLEVRCVMDKYTSEGKVRSYYYTQPVCVNMVELHSLADWEEMVGMMKLLCDDGKLEL